jgi:hypothetical protein
MAKTNTVDTVIAAVEVDTAVPVELTPIEAVVLARRASAEAVGRAYGADRAYAVALNNLLAPKWYDETADSITDLGKVVKAEKKEYFKALKAYAPKHSNPLPIGNAFESMVARKPRASPKRTRAPRVARARARAPRVAVTESRLYKIA